MKSVQKHFLFFFLLFFLASPIHFFSQSTDSLERSFSLGAKFNYSYIFIHAKDVLPNENYFPRGAEINFNWQRLDQRAWEQCNCYPKGGLILSFYDLDNPEVLGYAYNLAWYVEPVFRSHKRLSYSVRGATGVSYQTNPFDSITNPTNQAYSLPVAAFVLLNFGIQWKMNDHLRWNVALNLNHTSNGGLKDPNKGLNFPSLSVGADYTFKPVEFKPRPKTTYHKGEEEKLHKEFALYYSNRAISHGEKKRFGIYGISGIVSWRVGRISALSGGMEGIIDFALKERLRRKNLTQNDHRRLGLLLGHEFLMGKFTFSQQLGIYLYNRAGYSDWYFRYNDRLYQRYGLKYALGKLFILGVDLKVDRYIANFVDFRLGVYF